MKQLSLMKILFSCIFVIPVLMRRFFQFRTEEEVFTLAKYEDDLEVEDEEEEDNDDKSKGSSTEFVNRRYGMFLL